MKKDFALALLGIFVLAFASARLQGQISAYDWCDSLLVFDRSNIAVSKTVNTFDSRRNVTLKQCFAINGSSVTADYSTVFLYDSKGNLLLEECSVNSLSSDKNSYRYVYTYDSQQRLVSMEYYLIHDGTDEGIYRLQYTYSSSQLTQCLAWQYNSSVSQWEEYEKTVYTYDSYGFQNSETSTVKENSLWNNRTKTEKVYYPNGDLVSETVYKGKGNAWLNLHKTIYAYNASNTLLSFIGEQISTTGYDWKNYRRTTYEYLGSTNNPLLVTCSLWKTGSETWQAVSREEYFYVQDKLSSVVCQLADTTGSLWYKAYEKNYSSNGSAQLTETTGYFGDGTKTGLNREEVEKDSKGNILLFKTYRWDPLTLQWEVGESVSSAYRNRFLETREKANGSDSRLTPYYREENTFDERNLITRRTVFDYNSDNNSWKQNSRTEFFYPDDLSNIEQSGTAENSAVKIWHANGNISVQSACTSPRVNVYSLHGRQVYTGNDSQIATEGWENGAYIVSVSCNREIKSAKIVISNQ